MEHERRSAPRARVKLQARWEGALSRENATVTDISRSGCFVLTGGKVDMKELVWLEIHLTEQQVVNFWAEVVDQASEIGGRKYILQHRPIAKAECPAVGVNQAAQRR